MKIYFWVVGLAMLFALIFGIVAPGLISAKNTELVLFGWVLIIFSIPACFFICKKIHKEIKNAKI